MKFVLKYVSLWFTYYHRLKTLNSSIDMDTMPLKFVLAAEYYEAELAKVISEQHKKR